MGLRTSQQKRQRPRGRGGFAWTPAAVTATTRYCRFAPSVSSTTPVLPSTVTRCPSLRSGGGVAGADHRRDPVLPGDDRRMGEDPAAVGDQRAHAREHDRPGRGRHRAHHHVARPDLAELVLAHHHPHRAACIDRAMPVCRPQRPRPVRSRGSPNNWAMPPQDAWLTRRAGGGSRSKGGSPAGRSPYAYGPGWAMAHARCPLAHPGRLPAVGTIEQRRAGILRLQEEHVLDGGQLAPLDEPASDLQRQIAEESRLDAVRPPHPVLQGRIGLAGAGQGPLESLPVGLRVRGQETPGLVGRLGCVVAAPPVPPGRVRTRARAGRQRGGGGHAASRRGWAR